MRNFYRKREDVWVAGQTVANNNPFYENIIIIITTITIEEIKRVTVPSVSGELLLFLFLKNYNPFIEKWMSRYYACYFWKNKDIHLPLTTIPQKSRSCLPFGKPYQYLM